jgi:hypothetical protein
MSDNNNEIQFIEHVYDKIKINDKYFYRSKNNTIVNINNKIVGTWVIENKNYKYIFFK